MKILKYILGLLLLLIVIFIGMGFVFPSVSYGSEIVVDKPIEEAWGVISDETKVAQWIKGLQKMELVSGTPNTVGAVSNIYVEDGGQEFVMKETITAIKPNELIAMTFSMDIMDMEYEMTAEEKDGKTIIKSQSKTTGNGMFARSMISFMKGAMQAQEDENMGNLKKVIEENTDVY